MKEIDKVSIPRFKEIRKPEMVALIVGIGSGSKVFQSFLDGHPEIYMIPGYPLMYFYPHWYQWVGEGKTNSWESIIDAFCYHHPSVIDTRRMPGSETLDKLGEEQNEWVDIDENLFKKVLFHLLEQEAIHPGTFLLAIHYAYSFCRKENLKEKKTVIYHIHVPFYVNQYLAKDFPDLKVIMMSRDPRSNLDRRVENSMFKADSPKLRESDFLLYKKRAYRHMIRIVLEGFDSVSLPSIQSLRVIKHEDLVNRLNDVLGQSIVFLGIKNDPCLYESTFSSKIWRTSFYDISKSQKVNPDVASQKWREIISAREWYIIEGLTFDILSEYGYKPEKYSSDTWLNRLGLFFLLLLPSTREKIEFFNLFSIKNFLNFIKIVRSESKDIRLLKDYVHNAYYQHKWTNQGLNLHKPRFYVSFLKNNLKKKENGFLIWIAQSLYITVSILRYIFSILTYPIEIWKRILTCYSSIFRRIKGNRIIPKIL